MRWYRLGERVTIFLDDQLTQIPQHGGRLLPVVRVSALGQDLRPSLPRAFLELVDVVPALLHQQLRRRDRDVVADARGKQQTGKECREKRFGVGGCGVRHAHLRQVQLAVRRDEFRGQLLLVVARGL